MRAWYMQVMTLSATLAGHGPLARKCDDEYHLPILARFAGVVSSAIVRKAACTIELALLSMRRSVGSRFNHSIEVHNIT